MHWYPLEPFPASSKGESCVLSPLWLHANPRARCGPWIANHCCLGTAMTEITGSGQTTIQLGSIQFLVSNSANVLEFASNPRYNTGEKPHRWTIATGRAHSRIACLGTGRRAEKSDSKSLPGQLHISHQSFKGFNSTQYSAMPGNKWNRR